MSDVIITRVRYFDWMTLACRLLADMTGDRCGIAACGRGFRIVRIDPSGQEVET